MCDKIILSQGEDFVFNFFGNKSYLYKDILHHQKFVFLPHGVTQGDISGWLARANKNISLFETTTNMEYQSILDGAYYYDEGQVKCTGFPRHDYLYDKRKDLITFMPTWRAYLVDTYNVMTDSHVLKKEFEKSTYCQMYKRIFCDIKLLEAARKYQYEIGLIWHPVMPRECIKYFDCSNIIKIFDRSYRYKDVLASSKLVITDYSSAVFDFAYLRKPIVYYQKDAEEFYSGKHTYRRGYFNYERDGFGEVEYTAEALVNRIIEYMENGCQLKELYRERIEKPFHIMINRTVKEYMKK